MHDSVTSSCVEKQDESYTLCHDTLSSQSTQSTALEAR